MLELEVADGQVQGGIVFVVALQLSIHLLHKAELQWLAWLANAIWRRPEGWPDIYSSWGPQQKEAEKGLGGIASR